MVKCDFCGESVKKGTGKMFVRKDGTFNVFCSNKCDKNYLKLKRSPKGTRWTAFFAEEKGITGERKKKHKENAKKEESQKGPEKKPEEPKENK